MNVKLSILIPTVIGREAKLQKLMDVLEPQFDELFSESIFAGEMPIEILFDKDNKEVSIGLKRQRLIEKANGEYIVFIDDDDLVSPTYIRDILNNTGADCIGFLIECTFDGKDKCIAKASNKYKAWGEFEDGYRYVRSTYHKTPVRREIALKVGFPDQRFGEDHVYSMGLVPYLKTENFINRIMYYYQYEHEDHNIKYGIK